MKNKSFFVIVVLLLHINLFAQTIISGTVKEINTHNFLTGASILAKQPKTHKTLAYAIVNFEGNYVLKVQSKVDSLVLSVSYLGYYSETIIIKNHTQTIDFELRTSKERLKEVIIKSPIISKRGDTLTYRVSGFKKTEDKAIIDVIKRLPGIEVMNNGTIYYNDKPINKFYIENMDLLEGRYNLASNNLPAKQVASVQIYENHQPIKLLDSLQFSDRAALNIKLKNSFSYAFPAEISIGYKPILWRVKLVPILFTKKYQMLTVLQSNNTGKLLQNENLDLTNTFTSTIDVEKWLSLSSISTPLFQSEKYLDNQSFLSSINYLAKLKNDNFLKINISFTKDNFIEKAVTNTSYYLTNDTLQVLQIQQNNYKHNTLSTQVIFEKNKKNTYLKNNFTYKYNHFLEDGIISNNSVSQHLTYPLYSLSNKLRWSFPVGKQILSWYANLKYNSTQQALEIAPGQYNSLLNNGISYKKTQQFLQKKNFSANTGIGFTKKFHDLILENNYTLTFQKSLLNSHIGIYNPSYHQAGGNFENNTSFLDISFVDNINLLYTKNAFTVKLDLPLMYRIINIDDKELNKCKKINSFLWNYDFGTSYSVNKLKFHLLLEKNTVFNDLEQNYYGYILQSYQQLKTYDAPILKKTRNKYTFHIKYKDVLEGFSASIRTSYQEEKSNIIYQFQYFSNGLSVVNAVQQEAYTYRKNMKLSLGKYFSKIKTNTKLQLLFTQQNSPMYTNNNFRRVYNNTAEIVSQINFPLTKYFSFYFTYQWSKYSSKLSNSFMKQHFINDIYIYPFTKKSHSVKISNDLYIYSKQLQQNNKVFVNLSYRYKSIKKPFEIFVKINNLTNVNQYIDYYHFDYIDQKTEYNLRPTQILCGVNFSF